MQHCHHSCEMKSPHNRSFVPFGQTFHSDQNQSITFCLAVSLAVMGSLGISQQEISKEMSFKASLCDKNVPILSKRLVPPSIFKHPLPRCALLIHTRQHHPAVPVAHTSPARPREEFRHLLPSAVLFLLVHLPLAQATAICLSPLCPYVTCERDTTILHIRRL